MLEVLIKVLQGIKKFGGVVVYHGLGQNLRLRPRRDLRFYGGVLAVLRSWNDIQMVC